MNPESIKLEPGKFQMTNCRIEPETDRKLCGMCQVEESGEPGAWCNQHPNHLEMNPEPSHTKRILWLAEQEKEKEIA